MDDGLLLEVARIGGEELGGEIVCPFHDGVHGPDQVASRLRQEAGLPELDAGRTPEGGEGALGGVELGRPHVLVADEDLPVLVRLVDEVIVQKDDAPHPCMRERVRRGAAQASDTHHEEALLPERRVRK
jgi:hypothetical protein